MANRKRDRSEEYRLHLKEQERIQAGYIKDRYPHVVELIFQFTFRDPDPVWQTVRPPWDEKIIRRPQHSALFKFDCRYEECVGGGFDLSSEVRQMIESGEPECSGVLSCQGWQDRERVGQHHCWLELTYKVTASYSEGSVARV